MIVVFNATEFRTFYPKFTEELISDEQLDNLFQLACTFIDNTDKSRFPYDPDRNIYTRKQMLYLLVCHLATNGIMGGWTVRAVDQCHTRFRQRRIPEHGYVGPTMVFADPVRQDAPTNADALCSGWTDFHETALSSVWLKSTI